MVRARALATGLIAMLLLMYFILSLSLSIAYAQSGYVVYGVRIDDSASSFVIRIDIDNASSCQFEFSAEKIDKI